MTGCTLVVFATAYIVAMVMATMWTLKAIRPSQFRQLPKAGCFGFLACLPVIKTDFRGLHHYILGFLDNFIVQYPVVQKVSLWNRIIVQSHLSFCLETSRLVGLESPPQCARSQAA